MKNTPQDGWLLNGYNDTINAIWAVCRYGQAAWENIREGGLLNLTDPAELATGNNGARFIHHAHRAVNGILQLMDDALEQSVWHKIAPNASLIWLFNFLYIMPMTTLYILHNPLGLCKFFDEKSYGIS